MDKKYLIIATIILLIAIPLAYYLISPAFKVVEKNEEFPAQDENIVNDNLESMDKTSKEQFETQTKEMMNKTIEMNDFSPMQTPRASAPPQIIKQADFKPRAHDVEGKALLIKDDQTKKITLRFEDFETINGPDLHIYLASDLGIVSKDYVDLGKIKATKGNVNYDIPDSVDTNKYNKVLVWCVPFGVLFSYADLE